MYIVVAMAVIIGGTCDAKVSGIEYSSRNTFIIVWMHVNPSFQEHTALRKVYIKGTSEGNDPAQTPDQEFQECEERHLAFVSTLSS